MANIDSKLNTIRNASSGEDVRDAIIGALRDINNDVPADMSNPEDYRGNMAAGSDYSDSFNPPKLVRSIYIQQPNTGGKSMKLETIDITRNGKYPTDDPNYNPDEEIRYYKEVNVKVPQLANAIEMETVEITQNGLYNATEWNVDGLRSINVNVQGASGDGPFQVEFYDKVQTDPTAAVKETQLIPKGGSAITSYQPVSPTGQIFTGWNPDPVNVTRDIKCYPRFVDKTIVPGEILDDWEIICSNGGANYALGNYKNLPFSFTWKVSDILNVVPNWVDHPDESYYPDVTATMNANFIMYKVAVGEQGTKSTWLSRPTTCTLSFANPSLGSPGKLMGTPWGGYPGYSGSVVDLFLENVFFPTMANCFHQHIKGVNKYHQALDPAKTTPPYNQTVINRHIWIPSIKEIMTTGAIEYANNQTNLHIPIDNASYNDPALNKEIFYDNVPNAMAYFREVLGLSTQDFLDSMMASGMNFVLRDSYTHDTGHTGWYYPTVSQGTGIIYDYNCTQGYHLDGNLMIGFCLD